MEPERNKERLQQIEVFADDQISAFCSGSPVLCPICAKHYVTKRPKVAYIKGVCPVCYQRALNEATAAKVEYLSMLVEGDRLRQQKHRMDKRGKNTNTL